MVNSTIQPKKKKCKCGCGNEDYIFSKGLIKSCWQKQYAKKIPKVSLKKKEQTTTNEELENWFKDREKDIIDSGQRCWECGNWISPKLFRHSSHHFFAKSLFPSVSTNEHNFLCLCVTQGCHQLAERSVEDFSKMKIWKEAVERYQQFKHLITEKHKYQSLFEQYAN